MSRKPTMTLIITTLALLGLLTASINANAGRIRQWTDPETGETVFGDAPRHAAAKHIRVQPSKGLTNVFCNDDCARQTTHLDLAELTKKFHRDSECKRLDRWYTGDVFGKKLAHAARNECAESKARRELGLPGNSGSTQAEYGEHFEREGERRQRQTDRAIQLNEGWQNRQAIDRQTDAIKQADRDGRTAQRNHHQELQRQTRAIEGMERKIDREFSPLTRYIRGH